MAHECSLLYIYSKLASRSEAIEWLADCGCFCLLSLESIKLLLYVCILLSFRSNINGEEN